MVEQLTCNEQVVSSILTSGSIFVTFNSKIIIYMEILFNFFIVFYILFCLLWSPSFNIRPIWLLITRLGLDHSWPMFVTPQLYNARIKCHLEFADLSTKTFEFSDPSSKSLIHRKYIDSLQSTEHLKGALSDYLINFSGIKNISKVHIEISETPIQDYNEAWKEYRLQEESEY